MQSNNKIDDNIIDCLIDSNLLPLLSKGGYFWIENALEYSIVRNENNSRFFFFLLHLYAYRIRLAVRFLVEHAMWWAKNRNVNANIGGHISPISCCMLCWSSFESSQIKLMQTSVFSSIICRDMYCMRRAIVLIFVYYILYWNQMTTSWVFARWTEISRCTKTKRVQIAYDFLCCWLFIWYFSYESSEITYTIKKYSEGWVEILQQHTHCV